MEQANPFEHTKQQLSVGDRQINYFSLKHLADPRVETLPYSIRVLLESALRNCDEYSVKKSDIETILNWKETSENA